MFRPNCWNLPQISKPVVKSVIAVGSKVRIKNLAPDYKGHRLASFVYKNVYTITELKNNPAVLSVINTAVNINDLILSDV